MKISARQGLVLAAVMAAVSFGGAAKAGTVFPTDQASYATWRVAAAFDIVADQPVVTAMRVPMAEKGDLPMPASCAGMAADSRDECMDTAYEAPSVPSVVLEARAGTTSTLTRLDPVTIAGIALPYGDQSE